MRFKKSKNEILNEINAISIDIERGNLLYSSPNDILTNIEYAIQKAVNEAFATLMRNTYTDEDFTKDLEQELTK